jgi:hypothetical protein
MVLVAHLVAARELRENSAKPASMPTSISRVKAFSASGRSIVKIAI